MGKTESTQSFIPIQEIRDGVVVRSDSYYCSILLVSAINFDLKSSDERLAILFNFQQLLNSIEVGIEILIQSRKSNIVPYIEYLDKLEQAQKIELLRIQTREYKNFVKDYTDSHDIMTKNFFIIIKYAPILSTKASFFASPTKKEAIKEEIFQRNKLQLDQRVSFMQNNIRGLGLKAIQLGTEEITELFYQTFNPGEVFNSNNTK